MLVHEKALAENDFLKVGLMDRSPHDQNFGPNKCPYQLAQRCGSEARPMVFGDL